MLRGYDRVVSLHIGWMNDKFFLPLLRRLTLEERVKLVFFSVMLMREKKKITVGEDYIDLIKRWIKSGNGLKELQSLRKSYYLFDYCILVMDRGIHWGSILLKEIFDSGYKDIQYKVLLYLDVLLNRKEYLVKDNLLKAFVNQDIDQIDTVLPIVDYIQEKHELDLTELGKDVRIFVEFLRRQG